MSEQHFKVVFNGQLLDGFDQEGVRQRFAERFRAPEQLVERVFGGGAVVIKKDLEHATALRLVELLNGLGMRSKIKEMPSIPSIDHLSLVVEDDDDEAPRSERADSELAPSTESSRPACPKCGSDQVQSDECQSCGVIVSKYIEIQARAQAQDRDPEQDEAAAAQLRRQERVDALNTSMDSKQAFQASWKVMGPVILVLFMGWRWYHKLVPDAFTEAELKESYVEGCFEYEGCAELLDNQWDACFEQADYARYQDATATRLLAEEEEFVERLDQCLVDKDGDPMFY